MSSVPPPPPMPPTVVRSTPGSQVDPPKEPAVESPTPDLPPPDADPHRSGSPSRKALLLAVLLGVAGIGVGALMTLLWMSAQSERDDANAERDQAIAARNAADEATSTAQSELIAANDALTAAEGEIARLEARIDDLEAELAAMPNDSSSDDVAALEAQVESLTAQVEQLTEENAALTAVIESARAEAASEAPEPASTGATFDAASTPEFARYMGEVLSSRTGSSRLSATQSTCFGTAIINDIGLDALGAGLHNARTAAANNAVVGAMQRAADACGIDQALIFS